MLNKIVLTKGAVFDYEEIVCNMQLNRSKFRAQAEKIIKDTDEGSLRQVFYDSDSNKELMLFLRRGYDFGIMRLWILEGICEKDDYCEEMERSGAIREWLEIVIE